MDHEKINYDLIVAVLEYIVVGEHEVCWTAFSLNYSSLFYSSSLAFQYLLGPAFWEHKINNFLNRYQRRAPIPERFSFSPCLFCNWYCNWACGISWHTWIASNSQFSPFEKFYENFHSLCAKAIQNPKFPISTERKKRKRKVIPKFSTATWPSSEGKVISCTRLTSERKTRQKKIIDSCCRLSFFVLFFFRCCLEEILIFVVL